MRQPLRSKQSQARAQIVGVQSFQAPVAGWNARDSLADMKPSYAVSLINWWPLPTYLESRPGNESYGTSLTGAIETLAVYNALDGSNEMFAFSDSGSWDVSSSGAGVATGATVTEGRWQWVNFGDGTNNYLILCNGTDKPLYYNGSAWLSVDSGTSPALSGVTSSALIYPEVYKGRLFFIQKNTLSFWYLAAGAAGGALTKFDLSSYAKRGGYLMAIATWSFDGGNGPDDYIAFATSEGEIIVYSGTNPSSASDWVQKGVYYVGNPLGRRCFVKFGGDVLFICEEGVVPLSVYLQSTTVDRKRPITDIITNAFNEAQRVYGSNFGWEGCFYQNQNALIFNIPVAENQQAEQFCMQTITSPWTRFTAWNANTFCVYNGELYFGGDAEVFKAWTGTDDNGSDIEVYGKTAFAYFGSKTQETQFKLFRPVIAANGNLAFLTGLDIDFNDSPILGSATYSVTSGAVWDVSKWDESYWAANLQVQKVWTSPQQNMGYSAAGKIKFATNALTVQWMSSDYVYERGGVL